MYLQQTGRGGRDGEHCVAVLHYSSKDLLAEDIVKEEMKEYYINKSECRRKITHDSFWGLGGLRTARQ